MFDFHTHRLSTPPGTGIVCLPREVVLRPETFSPAPGGLYSVGVHPWWTADAGALPALLEGVERLLPHPQVVALGECGLDRLRGAALPVQEDVFRRQIALSEHYGRPVTIHCVRAFDVLLRLKRLLRPTSRWTVHGFRGRAALARQLLDAGLDLSFGLRYDAESFAITPPDCRHRETDAE